MTSEQKQLEAVRPLIDQIQNLLSAGQHPEASPRFQSPEAALAHGMGFSEPKPKTALAECAEWHEAFAAREYAYRNPDASVETEARRAADKHATWAAACREADSQ